MNTILAFITVCSWIWAVPLSVLIIYTVLNDDEPKGILVVLTILAWIWIFVRYHNA